VIVKRIAGTVWIATGLLLVAYLLQLWSRLGGIVDERLRWWARLGLLAGPVLGYFAGIEAREMAGWGSGRSHAVLLKLFWIPPASLTAFSCLAMTLAGAHDESRAVFGAFLAYWAGFDTGIAAWPLACGRPYRFLRDIPPEDPGEP
jgi:hypothetical protein